MFRFLRLLLLSDLHVMLSSVCRVYRNQCSEDHTFLIGVKRYDILRGKNASVRSHVYYVTSLA
jgi:DMSO/TMAO reductase YedYZ molybdopterin-dependent catalytic subunit